MSKQGTNRDKVKSWSERIHLTFTCLFAFGINMPHEYIPKFIVAWLASQIFFIIYHFEGFIPYSKKNLPNILLILFYLWCSFTIFYTENKLQAFKMLEQRLTLLIIPILCLFSTQITKKRNYLIYFFVLGNLVNITYCLIHFLNTGLWGDPEIRHINFSASVNTFGHYNYIGLNLSIGLLLLLYLFKYEKIYIQLIILFLIAVIYILFIFLSQARMSLFTILLASAIIILNRLFHYKAYKISIIISFVLLLFLLFIMIKNPRLNYVSSAQEMSFKKIDYNRNIIWGKAIELIKNRPLFGYGIGDKTIVLENGLSYNSHNQILDLFLEGGAISNILFWGAWLGLFIFEPPKKIKFYSITISSIIFISLMTESLLNRISGISLFIFIMYFFENTNVEKSTSKLSKRLNLILFSFTIIIFISILPVSFLILKKENFNPKIPRTYTMEQINKVPFFKLPGIIPKELKRGTNGYRIDSTSKSHNWDGNAYSFTQYTNPLVSDYDSIVASAFCYVSEDFNGTWVRISSEGSSYENVASFYDLKHKGSWQKLIIKPKCNTGEVPIYLYIAKYNSTSFDSFQGYVIFAYPEVKINGKPYK